MVTVTNKKHKYYTWKLIKAQKAVIYVYHSSDHLPIFCHYI